MHFQYLLIPVAIFSFAKIVDAQPSKELVNKKVERTIDIVSQLLKIQCKVTLENVGKTPQKSFLVTVEPKYAENLAYIGASKSGGADHSKTQLTVTEVTEKGQKNGLWEVALPQPLEASRTVVVELEYLFTHYLRPHPSHITQGEKQLVRYDGNMYFYSPYLTTTQTTTVLLSSSNVESYTKTKHASQSDTTINYGPFENIPPLSQSELSVHYENNNPFLTVTNLERVIEVSHWGNVAVEESVQVGHTGAILKGSFSRYEYQREQSGASSIKSFKTILPAAANDVYYRDEIGNISTSHLRLLEDSVEVDLRPRFPLFGGWKTNYILGYNLPSYEYLYSQGDNFMLRMRFVDHIFDDMTIDHATVKIILPEGATVEKLEFPYDVKVSKQEKHFTYLDTFGRPTIVARKDNLVENHIVDFELHYKFPRIIMLQEPLLIILAFYLLFLLVIFYVRLDFSITKNPGNEHKLRVAGMCERVQTLQDKISGIFHQQDNVITQSKLSKDVASIQNVQKKVNNECKSDLQAMQDLQAKLKTESHEAAEKVNDLLKLNKTLKETLSQYGTLVEKLANEKINKNAFIQNEQSIVKKRDDIINKIDNVISLL